jgi:hypothetical protein
MASLAEHLAAGLDPVLLAERQGMVCDPWQARVLRSTAPRLLMLCARQTGKSTLAAICAVHTALYQPGGVVLLLSPSMRQSQELFRKCLAVYRGVGKPIGAEALTTMALTLENGSRIVSLPGGEQTIRGYSAVALLVVDEAGLVADESYFAATPMVGVSNGRIVLLGTPHGQRGFFYQIAQEPRGWEVERVPASECLRLSPEFLQDELQTMGAYMYSQEYELAFVADELQAFGEEWVKAAMSREVAPLWPTS